MHVQVESLSSWSVPRQDDEFGAELRSPLTRLRKLANVVPCVESPSTGALALALQSLAPGGMKFTVMRAPDAWRNVCGCCLGGLISDPPGPSRRVREWESS